jgi:hypothetical protein
MMETVMTWVGPTLDVLAIVLLAAVLWRLGRDPGAAWGAREARLQTIFDDLRTLVAQSEGLARDLDGKLAGREERLRALLTEAQAVTSGRSAAAEATPGRPPRLEVRAEASSASAASVAAGVRAGELEPAALASRIEALADAGTAVGEIARRLGVAVAEVRLVIGLKAARAARRRATASEARAHA